ncbi:MAG: hypothetical protein AAB569_02370 [Patescibacteria group bacterium]
MKESSQKNLKIEGVRRTLKITAGLTAILLGGCLIANAISAVLIP